MEDGQDDKIKHGERNYATMYKYDMILCLGGSVVYLGRRTCDQHVNQGWEAAKKEDGEGRGASLSVSEG